MTPKEKAKELILAFNKTEISFWESKACAKICVDEIIKYSGTSAIYEINGKLKTVPSGFWAEVKSEIETL